MQLDTMGAENLIQTQHIKHRIHLRAKKKSLSSVAAHCARGPSFRKTTCVVLCYFHSVFFLVGAVLHAVAMIQHALLHRADGEDSLIGTSASEMVGPGPLYPARTPSSTLY